MKPAVSIILLTDGKCQLGCPACPTGRGESYSPPVMTYELGKRIVEKFLAEASIIQACLYYFNEPFFHPEIKRFVELYKENGLLTFLSSNFSFNEGFFTSKVLPVLELDIKNLIISTSGFTPETARIYHRKSDIELVKRNMIVLSDFIKKHGLKTFIRVSWHEHTQNEHEKETMRKFVEDLGFHFSPYGLSVLPLDRPLKAWESGEVMPEEHLIKIPLKQAKVLSYKRRHWPCMMQRQVMVVDGNGMLLNCSDRYGDHNLRGSFFDKTVKQHLKDRMSDNMCRSCRAVGGHIYAAQEYTRKRFSIQRVAENLYRRLGLQRFPEFSAKMAELFYIRP